MKFGTSIRGFLLVHSCSRNDLFLNILQVNKNAFLLKSIDELFSKGKEDVTHSALIGFMQKVLISCFFYPFSFQVM